MTDKPTHAPHSVRRSAAIPMQLQLSPSAKGIEVLAITAGIGNGWKFPADVLKASVPKWTDVQVFTDHTRNHHSVRDLGGVLCSPEWDDQAQGIKCLLAPSGPAAQVIRDLAEASLSHPSLPVGMSADIIMRVNKQTVLEIVKVRSLDVVMHPARGGKFIRVLQGEIEMNEEEENQYTLSDNSATADRLQAQIAASEKLLADQCRYLLNGALTASRLPEITQARLRRQFEGHTFEAAQLSAAIEDAYREVSALTGASAVKGPRISGMFDTNDQLQVAVDDLFGAPRDKDKQSLQSARLSGIRELYLMLTGDIELHGGYNAVRAQFGGTTSDFSGLVKNALNKIVVNSFDRIGKAGYDWWTRIVTMEHFNSLNTITGTLVGGVASLPSVAEQGEYTELAVGDSPETATFTKYGGYIPLTLESIDRDESRKLSQFAVELGNAAMRNISEQVAAIFTANAGVGPTMADGGALFNNSAVTSAGGHANLLTTAIGSDYSAWTAIANAVYNQPMLVKNATGYYGTGKKLAIDPKFCLVPRALKNAAEAIFLPRWASDVQTLATVGGPTYGGFVVPLVVPEWTDLTDYAAVCDPAVAPSIIIGERFGLAPEIYIAGSETDAAVFMNDEHRLKVRQFLAIVVGDFRPLHKENV